MQTRQTVISDRQNPPQEKESKSKALSPVRHFVFNCSHLLGETSYLLRSEGG